MLPRVSKKFILLLGLVWCTAPTIFLLNSRLAADQMAGNVWQALEEFNAPVIGGLTLEERGWLATARRENVALEGIELEDAREKEEWFGIFRIVDVREKSRFRAFIAKRKGPGNPPPQATHAVPPAVTKQTSKGSEIVAERKEGQKGQTPPKRAPSTATAEETAKETTTQAAPAAYGVVAERKKKREGKEKTPKRGHQPPQAPRTAAEEVVVTRKKPEELKLPTPILVVGMMKAGTTSIYAYFKCGMDLDVTQLSHYNCKPGMGYLPCGTRIANNAMAKPPRSAFDGLPSFHLYSELDGNSGTNSIHLPQYKYLPELYAAYPNATWILNLRDPREWLTSIDRWLDLRQRFINSHLEPDLPWQGRGKPGERPTGEKDEDMINFYNKQAERVRDFAKTHPSLHFVEVHIDQPEAGQIMEDSFGISRQCWGNKNVNTGNATWTEQELRYSKSKLRD